MEQVQQPGRPTSPDTAVGQDEKMEVTAVPGDISPAPAPRAQPAVSQKQLINKINLLNFQGVSLSVVFKHRTYQRTKVLKAHPMPCQDARLTCQWETAIDNEQLMEAFDFQCLYVPKGQQLYEVKAQLKNINDHQIVLDLPPVSQEISERKVFRYPCRDVAAYMFQNGATFFGRLEDFSAFQFRISIHTVPPQTFRWIDSDEAATIVFVRGQETLFSGDCRIIKQHPDTGERQLILEPIKRQMRRFGPREFRSYRRKLVPSPNAVFQHPLFSSPITLKIHDISGSGFSVEEENHTAVLLPGMIIPALDLIFSDGNSLRCAVQVVYSHLLPDSNTLRCGLVILDMAVEAHTQLLALLHQAGNANIYISNKVDLQSLWDFFFETGFIYPQKYKFIEANKAKIKSTYEKLYNENPAIASHFIFQDNGRILAHMAIVRFYDKAWLIHHHAAIRNDYHLAGIAVLNQVGQYIHDCNRLHSMNMEYVFCYFRPDNKFPAHVFGGAARHINNPQLCSIDQFAYFHHAKPERIDTPLPKNWELEPVSEEDLRDLANFYETQSGGLMLKGLHLEPGRVACQEVQKAYRDAGLKRDRQVYALRHKERLCAIFMVNHADLGLNMSDLTNSITIIVVNPDPLTQDLFLRATNMLAHSYEEMEVSVLLYPQETASLLDLAQEKSYCLWVLLPYNSDPYFRYLKRFLKFARH